MKDPIQARIEREINEQDVVLFMKGTPVFPQCGFSAVMVQVLSHLCVKFKGIDVLSDPALRQGIKAFSDWLTVPQLYVKRPEEPPGGLHSSSKVAARGAPRQRLRFRPT